MNLKVAKWAGLAGTIIMAAMIGYSICHRGHCRRRPILLGMVWGQMSMVDLYVSFLLVYLWMFYREKTIGGKVFWLVLILVTGALATGLYIYLAASNSKTETEFFFGKQETRLTSRF
jgi:magnesium-transporting ATPase (P-type)